MSHTLTPYLIDTHCHLNLDDFKDDVQEVIGRAKANGIAKMMVVGTSAKEGRRALELAKKHDGLYPTIGYHPFYLNDLSHEQIEEELAQIEEMIALKEVVAVGEIGVDYFYDYLDKELQKRVFRRMLKLAKKYDKPIIIHSRNSFDDVLEILGEFDGPWKGVLHCFTGGPKVTRKVLDLGLHIGYTGLITYTKDRALLDSIAEAPIERIVVETDAPWLAPEPYRGQRCEPAYVMETARKISELKNLEFDLVKTKTSANAERLFQLG